MADAVTAQYEATYILGEETTPEQAETVLKDLTATIQKLGGSVTKHEAWGKRELAYPIKRNRAGFYTTLWLDLPRKQVSSLEKELRFDERIIRSLVTKAYTTAQPGSLYPVVEETAEKPARGKRAEEEETPAGAEAQLRMSSTKKAEKPKKDKAPEAETEADAATEEERLQKLDAALDDILKDEE